MVTQNMSMVTQNMSIDMVDVEEFNRGTQIKVIGVGGGGSNAVEHMIRCHVQGVEFICANTDAQALGRTAAHRTIQLGQTGLGAGSRPEKGRLAAEMADADIRAAIEGAHLLFITAGMGGGTGTGAAPLIAKLAKEMGVLTVGVVTKPFDWEGARRMRNAEEGLIELEKNVDSLIIVLNDKLLEVLGDDVTQDEAFAEANDVLKNAVGGIAEIINVEAMVNVDFEDVRTVMSEQGKAMMGTAVASGPDRARLAAEQAVACPLLEGVDMRGAKGVLVLISACKGSLRLAESRVAMNTIRAFASPDAHVIYGTAYDESLGDTIRVTVVATGLDRDAATATRGSTAPAHGMATSVSPRAGHSFVADAVPTFLKPSGQSTASGSNPQPGGQANVWRPSSERVTLESMRAAGMEEYDIPAFLRQQSN